MQTGSQLVRPLTSCDLAHVQKLLLFSDYVYQRFTAQELSRLLEHYPGWGLFHAEQLQSFLLSQALNPPVAWIGGFGVSWSEHRRAFDHLDRLLDYLQPSLQARGVTQLYYSGNDLEQDWLRTPLLRRGFEPHSLLYAYDKFDYRVPTHGNQEVSIRSVRNSDFEALCEIERLCFAPLWRYDAAAFADIAATHPYFVVAELEGRLVGYQFNTVDEGYGYLIRIAVHPAFSGQGIGARLMAEAISFFARAGARRIMLNTQEDNQRAHRLYEWFGFVRMPQRGFILRKELSAASTS
ncbi:MAG: GNAT family N-acetyltransferase [Thermogemmatispora sp.]|uniref:GNAT family N-acetyltransferase n=1 Tax=Thermogemmatispora sp. TaxID=1968838 RepID=UPI00260622AE|nr:GNAT family N-acetyltransferase [Thermogemmatispora sp.]MBX5459115.1 GNAT family N-acetyltransferase [Thermogemmatispora sp.]